MKDLTERQAEVLTYLHGFLAANLYAPTLREIGTALHMVSTNGVKDHLNALAAKGHLRFGTKGSPRTLRLANDPRVPRPKGKRNAQHSSAEDRWYTPLPIIEVVREVLGPITLDPASDAFGNARVGAARFFDEAADGLAQPWTGTIFLNPPGGTVPDPSGRTKRAVSRAGLFWRKLQETSRDPFFDHAIYLAFSVEQLSSTQRPGVASCSDFPLVVLEHRVRFDLHSGEAGTAPTHASALVYVPGAVDRTPEFLRHASRLGRVLLPHRAQGVL